MQVRKHACSPKPKQGTAPRASTPYLCIDINKGPVGAQLLLQGRQVQWPILHHRPNLRRTWAAEAAAAIFGRTQRLLLVNIQGSLLILPCRPGPLSASGSVLCLAVYLVRTALRKRNRTNRGMSEGYVHRLTITNSGMHCSAGPGTCSP